MDTLIRQLTAELRSAWRFRWYAVATAWVIAVLGLGVVARLPDIYEASARVYVDANSELRPLLTDRIVAPDVATHLAYVRQALLSRDYLQRVAAENGLDSAAINIDDREKVLKRLADTIEIGVAPADRRARPGANDRRDSPKRRRLRPGAGGSPGAAPIEVPALRAGRERVRRRLTRQGHEPGGAARAHDPGRR